MFVFFFASAFALNYALLYVFFLWQSNIFEVSQMLAQMLAQILAQC